MVKMLWQYDNNGDWKNFDAGASAKLEEAFVEQQAAGKLDLTVRGRAYNFSFHPGTMQQTNVDTGMVRPIRRVAERGVWEWQAEGEWQPYETLQSARLEGSFAKHPKGSSSLRVSGAEYTIDFKKMQQTREASGKARKVRRVTKWVPLDRNMRVNAETDELEAFETLDDSAEDTDEASDETEPEMVEPPKKKAKIEPPSKPAPPTASGNVGVIPVSTLERGGPAVHSKPGGTWQKVDSVLVLDGGVKGCAKVMGFDMDDTLIKTKSGNVFAKTADDWQWLCPEVPKVLRKLIEDGMKIVIFSNQSGIDGKKGYDTAKAKAIQTKISNIAKSLGYALQAFVSTKTDINRKPSVGMWHMLEEQFNENVAVDKSKSFYIGDAAGRTITTLAGRGKDFSCSDRQFAFNSRVGFKTPEELFLGTKASPFTWGKGFIPFQAKFGSSELETGGDIPQVLDQEVVLLVGFPGCGKTTFAKKHFVSTGRYAHVNRDTLKTPAKCLKVLNEALSSGQSAVVDNTNPKPDARAPFIKAAISRKVNVRCFVFQASMELAQHLNMYREIVTKGAHPHVPGIAYNMYKGGFVAPSLQEGFTSITNVSFVPSFKSQDDENLFFSFLP
ncbi:bifunctional polynucleotide phosphatase/kinase [Diplonema papillatum]|nr:bifunctional polynucleotide phosphatase/kinase [Diplonema papillatum]